MAEMANVDMINRGVVLMVGLVMDIFASIVHCGEHVDSPEMPTTLALFVSVHEQIVFFRKPAALTRKDRGLAYAAGCHFSLRSLSF